MKIQSALDSVPTGGPQNQHQSSTKAGTNTWHGDVYDFSQRRCELCGFFDPTVNAFGGTSF
jgi:hypothetical protein